MLLEMEPLAKIIKLVLQTGYIKGVQPVSLLIIARAESGKTSAMEDFSKVPSVYYTNDLTPKLLTDKIFPMIDDNEVTHIVIPDILTCVERNRATRMHFINLMKTLIEEGIHRTDAFHLVYEPKKHYKIRAGLITAITGMSYKQFKSEWVKIGFLSRMIPFSFDFPLDKVRRIFEYIAENEVKGPIIKQKIQRRKLDVAGSPELFREFWMVSKDVGSDIEAYGIRIQKSLQSLAKANAALDGRECVTKDDIDQIYDLSRWINYDFKAL